VVWAINLSGIKLIKMKYPIHKLIHNSFLHKLLGIIILLALIVILLIYLFSNLIFLDARHHLIFFLIILILIVFSLAGVFIHLVISPIHELERGVEELSKGNLDVVLKVKSKDEIGKVANAFNLMTVELKKMIKARDQLLLDVSHELRSPITRAKIALEMMPISKEKDSVMEDMREMEAMISELLETERLKSGNTPLEIQIIKVKDLISDVVSGFWPQCDKIKVHEISDKIMISVDKQKMGIVIKNLIENALKYSGNTIQPVEINVIDQSDKIIIQVEDFGPGIPEDKIGLLFEAFYRVDTSRSRKTGGYGLGLHLAKKIMDAHVAKIQLINKQGPGTTTGIIAELQFSPSR
jgi:signal transduction histidine kinase